MGITLKSPREIEKMRVAGQMVAEALELARAMVAPGTRTCDLDEAMRAKVEEMGGVTAFHGYHGYPAHVCTSVNEEVVHGIPGRRKLVEGDIVGVDFGAIYEGYYGDAAVTLPVGRIAPEVERLIDVCRRSLDVAIGQVRPGARLSTVSRAIQEFVEAHGYSVVRKFVGHGIGTRMHEDPQVPNFVGLGAPREDPVLRPGMVIAIEPMVNQGTHDVRVKKDGWTVVTLDRKLSAHFEHTVAVTSDGREILTALRREVAAAGTGGARA